MGLKALKPRLHKISSTGIDNHQPKSRWGHGRGGRPWRRLKDSMLLRDRHTCQHCKRVGGELELDHIINVAAGGTDDESNLQILCVDCHKIKSQVESSNGQYGLTSRDDF